MGLYFFDMCKDSRKVKLQSSTSSGRFVTQISPCVLGLLFDLLDPNA